MSKAPSQDPIPLSNRRLIGKSPVDILWACTVGLLFVFACLLFVPWTDNFPPAELDSSWYLVLSWAWESGLDFGREFIFTYGPWGFLFQGYEPSTFKYTAAAWVLFTASFLICATCVARALPWRWARFPWMFLLICIAGFKIAGINDARIFIMCWLGFVLHFYVDDRPLTIAKIVVAAAMALVSLGKFSMGMTALTVMSAIALDELIHRKIPWLFVIYLSAVALFWIGAGQRLASLPLYIQHALMLSIAYSQGEANSAVNEVEEVLSYAGCALLLLLIVMAAHIVQRPQAWPAKCRAALAIATLAAMLLLNFKAGYTRHDGHEVLATTSVLMFSMIYGAVLWRRFRGVIGRVFLSVVILSALVLSWSSLSIWTDKDLPEHVFDDFGNFRRRGADTLAVIRGEPRLRQAYEEYLSLCRMQRTIPDVHGTVDVYSYAQRTVLANGLQFRPRPVMQSYLAYTRQLAEFNADFLRGPRAPDSILFEIQPIDRHYPSMEDGASWPEILSRYHLVDARNSLFLFERNERPDEYSFTSLFTQTGRMDEWISVPDSEENIWAKIELTPTLTGKLLRSLYKSPHVYMQVRTANGQTNPYQIIPDVVAGGFLLSPFIADHMGFAMLNSTQRGQLRERSVSQIMLAGGVSATLGDGYERTFTITFSRLNLPQHDLWNVPGFDEYVRFRQLAPQLVVQIGGPVQLMAEEESVVMLAMAKQTRLLLPAVPSAKSLRLRFGIAWHDIASVDRVAPVNFRAYAMRDENDRGSLIWQQTLDPRKNVSDRAATEALITLPDPPPARIAIEAVPQVSGAPAFPYWSDIQLQ